MKFTHTLNDLLNKGEDTFLLKKKSPEKPQIRALQMLLYGLGFGDDLNWEKYRADGDYGGGTTKAVQHFLKLNKLNGNGEAIEPAVMELMLDRYHLVPGLRQLKNALKQGTLTTVYANDQPKALNNWQALQAAAEVSQASNSPDEDSAKSVLDQLEKGYGSGWEKALHESDTAQQKADQDIETLNQSKSYKVSDAWLAKSFTKTKSGVYTIGEELAEQFISSNKEALLQEGLTESAIKVIAPVSGNEGNLDAINTWDNAFMTFGMFQWTVGVGNSAGELPALLHKIKEKYPDTFQEYYGRYGMDVLNVGNTIGFLSLNGEKLNQPAEKERLRKEPDWAFRFWKSGLDSKVKLMEILHALDRINSFREHSDYRPLDRFFIGDLITSEYGMCLILDHHVNRPGHLMSFKHGKKDILGQALKNARLDKTDPGTWNTAEELKLIYAYLPLRASSSMTHGELRAGKIKKFMDRGELSKERFSFELTSVRSRGSLGIDEAAYPLINHEEYENRK